MYAGILAISKSLGSFLEPLIRVSDGWQGAESGTGHACSLRHVGQLGKKRQSSNQLHQQTQLYLDASDAESSGKREIDRERQSCDKAIALLATATAKLQHLIL